MAINRIAPYMGRPTLLEVMPVSGPPEGHEWQRKIALARLMDRWVVTVAAPEPDDDEG